jgi:hypothetical protein
MAGKLLPPYAARQGYPKKETALKKLQDCSKTFVRNLTNKTGSSIGTNFTSFVGSWITWILDFNVVH